MLVVILVTDKEERQPTSAKSMALRYTGQPTVNKKK